MAAGRLTARSQRALTPQRTWSSPHTRTALTSQRQREALASAIYQLLRAARRDRSSFSMRVPARGVAAIRVLITDGIHSPFSRSEASGSLNAALLGARHWL